MATFLLLGVVIFAAEASGEKPEVSPSLFAPTPIEIIPEILSSVRVSRSDTLYDLGCGDGRVPIITNMLYSAICVGIELEDAVASDAVENVRLNNLEGKVKIYQGDITTSDFSKASIVYLYLQPELSEKIRPRLLTLSPGSRIIAYDKRLPNWQPTRIKRLSNGKNLYIYVISEKYEKW